MEMTSSAGAVRSPQALPFPAEIHTLTSLRYIAAIWVVIFHWSNFFLQAPLVDDLLIKSGPLGVDFFFILSGFVLAHVYLRRQLEGRLDYWNFISRRVARIYPMHLLTLIAMIVFGVIAARVEWSFTIWDPTKFMRLHPGEAFRELLAHLLMIHAWGASDAPQFNIPSWSISAEWFAYLLFPLLTYSLGSARRWPAMTLALAVLFLIAFAIATQLGLGRRLFLMTWNVGALRILPDFLLGIALYRFGLRYSAGPKLAVTGMILSTLATIGVIYANAPQAAIVLGLGAMIGFAADAERHGKLGFLCRPFPVMLGEVSYSVYMLHFGVGIILFDLVLRDMQGGGMGVAVLLIALGTALVTALSYFSHRFFEVPSRNFLNRQAMRVMAPSSQNGEP